MEKNINHIQKSYYDLVGIGIGPSNLSTAALLDPLPDTKSCFFEIKKEFQWHAGMLFPEATIQVSHLKDLVTLVDPSSKFSFLNFLSVNKRLYRFATASFPQVKRREFNQYFQWVCSRLKNLQFDSKVTALNFKNGRFTSSHHNGEVQSDNVVMACGLSAKIPDFAKKYECSTVFHSIQYAHKNILPKGKRIVVVGGGQSGAEIINRLLADNNSVPEKITWITKRANFLPIDDSPFTNEFFTPSYSNYFFELPPTQQRYLRTQQVLASDGIENGLLEEIYRRLYEMELIDDNGKICDLHYNTSLVNLSPLGKSWDLFGKNHETGELIHLGADIVIFSTGFEYKIPEFLEPMIDRFSLIDGRFQIHSDFSIVWDGPADKKIYLQNGAGHVRGVADPNLSLTAWRSAKIINSLIGKKIYDIEDNSSPFEWKQSGVSIRAVAKSQ